MNPAFVGGTSVTFLNDNAIMPCTQHSALNKIPDKFDATTVSADDWRFQHLEAKLHDCYFCRVDLQFCTHFKTPPTFPVSVGHFG